MKRTNKKNKQMILLALFSAIIFLLAFTPNLGYIPIGPIRATSIHIPVIIGSLVLGPVSGGILGFLFGITSLISNTMNPTPTSFVFSPFYSEGIATGGILSLLVCFIPRILVGVVPHYVYKLLNKIKLRQAPNLLISGVCGSLTNTLLVMHMIYIFFKEPYAESKGMVADALYSAILLIIGQNGVPEAIVAGLVSLAVVTALKKGKLI